LIQTQILKKIVQVPKDIIILGETDTGKSYLAFEILKVLKERNLNFGYLNSDVGQSQIGVPSVLSSVYFKKKIFKKINPELKIFFGDITPSSNIEWFLLCFLKLYKESKKFMQNLIIDTTGFIKQPAAHLLKLLKVNILEDCYIISIGEPKKFEFLNGVKKEKIFLKPHFRVKKKSAKKREIYRQFRFKNYFKNFKKISLRFKTKKKIIENQLIGFQNSDGFLEYLGVVDKIKKGHLEILVPHYFDFKRINSIILGNLILDVKKGTHQRISSHFMPTKLLCMIK